MKKLIMLLLLLAVGSMVWSQQGNPGGNGQGHGNGNGNGGGPPLPLKFEYLSVKKVGDRTLQVQWKVAQVVNVEKFYVQVIYKDGRRITLLILPVEAGKEFYSETIKIPYQD